MTNRPPTRSQQQLLVEAARSANLFCSELGQPFARIPLGADGQQVVPLYSDVFRNWITYQFYSTQQKPPRRSALLDALSTLHAVAACEGAVGRVPTRVSSAPGQVFLDLADQSNLVEIDAGGWRVTSDLARLFRYNRNARPLPHPIDPPAANVLQQLRSLLNIRSDSTWTRILIWLVAALRPSGPYPTLVLYGPSGSGKSTLLRILRSLIDPGPAPSLPLPHSARALEKLAASHWVLAFDHVDKLRADVAAGLARLATGDVVTVRDRMHDPEGFEQQFQRPILLASSAVLPASAALIDRCLTAGLDAIPPAARRSEQDLFAAVDALRPALLGALCTAVSSALARAETVQPLCRTRFADAAIWVTAAAPALGLTAESIAREFEAGGNPVASVIHNLLDDKPEWKGSATDLLDEFRSAFPANPWPLTSKGLSQLLRRTSIEGVLMESCRTNSHRTIRLSKIGDASCVFRPLNAARFPI